MKRITKKILLAALSLLAAVVLTVVGYLAYVLISYHRIEDMQTLEISGDADSAAPVGEEFTLVTYNIGFGAYSPDYSFFMDGGEHSRALSREAVITNTNGALKTVGDINPDFILLQEVDTDGTRSYGVNQRDIFAGGMSGFDRVFAENYDSPYFAYPFNEPIGANKSGMMTLSAYNVEGAVRRSLPIEESLYKYLDLDRAYSVSAVPTADGKTLMLYNVHLSAYTSDGTIADEQMRMLSADMKAEYDKGNYVIAAGDFNKDMLGDSSKHFERSEGEFTWAKPFDKALLPEGFSSHSGENAPTCRNADSPYRADGTDFVLSVDGVIVSPNVKLTACETVSTGFKNSDHDPVKATVILYAED